MNMDIQEYALKTKTMKSPDPDMQNMPWKPDIQLYKQYKYAINLLLTLYSSTNDKTCFLRDNSFPFEINDELKARLYVVGVGRQSYERRHKVYEPWTHVKEVND